MTLPKHLNEAADRLKEAAARIETARAKPSSLEALREWLTAATDFSAALSEIQMFSNESIHEKLHELAARLRLGDFPTPPPH